MDDDLDDLINDIDGAGGSGGTKSSGLKLPSYTYEIPQQKSSVQQVNAGGKCYPIYLGGTALLDG